MAASAEEQARRIAQMERDGVADKQTCFDHVVAENRGSAIGARLNADRGQNQPAKEEPKKP